MCSSSGPITIVGMTLLVMYRMASLSIDYILTFALALILTLKYVFFDCEVTITTSTSAQNNSNNIKPNEETISETESEQTDEVDTHDMQESADLEQATLEPEHVMKGEFTCIYDVTLQQFHHIVLR